MLTSPLHMHALCRQVSGPPVSSLKQTVRTRLPTPLSSAPALQRLASKRWVGQTRIQKHRRKAHVAASGKICLMGCARQGWKAGSDVQPYHIIHHLPRKATLQTQGAADRAGGAFSCTRWRG